MRGKFTLTTRPSNQATSPPSNQATKQPSETHFETPSRTRPSLPSRDRVPSGNMCTQSPSSSLRITSSISGWSMPLPRSMGMTCWQCNQRALPTTGQHVASGEGEQTGGNSSNHVHARHRTKPTQTNPNQTNPNQTKPNQTKPNQTNPNQTHAMTHLALPQQCSCHRMVKATVRGTHCPSHKLVTRREAHPRDIVKHGSDTGNEAQAPTRLDTHRCIHVDTSAPRTFGWINHAAGTRAAMVPGSSTADT